MGIALATSMLPMVLCGPALARNCATGVSCMGPVLAPMHTTDGLAWAQCCPPQHATDDLAWAHHSLPNMLAMSCVGWPQSVLAMFLHGPSTGPNAHYRWSCMGPGLAPVHATDGLAWTHHWAPSMLPMVFYGPSAGHQACYWPRMNPPLAPKSAPDGFDWVHLWPIHSFC